MTTTTKPRKKKESHTSFRNGDLFCFHCGRSFHMEQPIQLTMMLAILKQFEKDHKRCEKTWKPPVVDQSLSEKEKALWWITGMNGERGTSSEAMFFHISKSLVLDNMMLNAPEMPTARMSIKQENRNSHPSDPDDFRRCYLLLQTVPEWKEKLHLMKAVSPVWEKLVQNWDLFTVLLEDQLRGKKNDLYTLMKDIGC